MAPTFVLLYGPPGVGKLTVARAFSDLTGAVLFDNHLSIGWASSIFPDRRSESHRRLRDSFRESTLSEVALSGQNVVMTFVYAHPDDSERVETMLRAYERQGGRVLPVQLTCDRAVHDLRVQSPGRAELGKMTSPARLAAVMEELDLGQTIQHRPGVILEITDLPPAVAAEIIATRLETA